MAAALEAWLGGQPALVTAWRAILWAAILYLLVLGVAVLGRPRRARSFLAGFAANWRANLLEAVLRAIAGLAFIAAASTTRAPQASRLIGLVLVVTALLMALLAGTHRRFAGLASRLVFSIFPLFGVMALALAALLAWFLSPGLETMLGD